MPGHTPWGGWTSGPAWYSVALPDLTPPSASTCPAPALSTLLHPAVTTRLLLVPLPFCPWHGSAEGFQTRSQQPLDQALGVKPLPLPGTLTDPVSIRAHCS